MKIPIAVPVIGKKEISLVKEAVESGWVSSKGKYIELFEEKFASFCGTGFGVATSSGTTALHLALVALGIGKGDEVIIPALTFIATANAVTYTGAKPIFIDSNQDYWGIDPAKIEEKITPQTKAIIPVHLYGHPCDMDPILTIARKAKLFVIEDAAEAHGAQYKEKKVGGLGDISCFSFYGNKIITTGEGGMCLTNNKTLADKMRILRDHGMNPGRKYWHDVVGFNYRMTNLQAALGVAQMEKIADFIERKRRLAVWYEKDLREAENQGLLVLHPQMKWAKCVYWLYSIIVSRKSEISRDKLIKRLTAKGIETRPFFYRLNKLPPYLNKEKFPVAEEISKRGLNLPSAPILKRAEISLISSEIKKSLRLKSTF